MSKKAEFSKQLDDADRTLEIVLARMDEFKKRLDGLEAKRAETPRLLVTFQIP